MKKIIVFLVICLVLLLCYISVLAENPNLLSNSGFEEGNEGAAYSWSTGSWDNKGEFKWDDSQNHSGNKSVCITNSTPTDSRYKQQISVNGGVCYILSCWVKTENVGMDNIGANLSVEGLLVSSEDVRGTNAEWKQLKLYGRTDKEQKSLIVTVGLGGYGSLNNGMAWFDDVVVEELKSAPANVNIVDLYNTNTSPVGSGNAKNTGLIAVILIVFLLLGLCAYMIYLLKTRKKVSGGKLNSAAGAGAVLHKTVVEKLSLDRKDILIMAAMTAVYLVIALISLGSLQSPNTSWIPAKSGESFIMDLGHERSISRITYYCGLGNGRDPVGKFRVEYLDASGKFSLLTTLDKNGGEIFRWKYVNVPTVSTSRIKITADLAGAELGEIGLFEEGSAKPVKGIRISEKNADVNDEGSVENLFDEQSKVVFKPSFMNSMYFDEIYHARTAYESLHGIEPFETTHPPLGKDLIALGIAIFGMTAFGWRIVGALFGAAMIPLMYMFGKKLFKKRFYAFCATFLMMFDFMHFTQTRIATIDVYVTFFIILMFYYMYDYFINRSYTLGFRQSLKPLFLSGLFFGLGAASKWIALYGAAGLALLFFITKYYEYRDYKILTNNRKSKKVQQIKNFITLYINWTLAFCILFFIIIPAAIYILSYIPFMQVPGPGHQLKDVFTYQINMYSYHAHLKATHPFSSEWWQWPVMTKPLWAYGGGQYYELQPNRVSSIFLFGNPAVWWAGILTAIVSLIISISKRDKKMIVVFMAIAAQYLPWMLVPRLTFIYHYFSIVPFIILTIVYVIKSLMDEFPRSKYIVYVYLAIVALLFIWFYPVLSGMEVDRSYVEHLKWLKTWAF